jgi:hypothetical protein
MYLLYSSDLALRCYEACNDKPIDTIIEQKKYAHYNRSITDESYAYNDHPLFMTTLATLPMHEVLWREVVWGLSRSLSCNLRGPLSPCEGIF